MICRHSKDGQQLKVADLNELTVLLDRSETAFTEVALNTWRAGLVGPPHRHEAKEQIFYITAGRGFVTVGGVKYAVAPGDLVYVPAGVVHQTIAGASEPLSYFLVNAFLDAEKEGHASFAEHIEKMKGVRQKQAQLGRHDVDHIGEASSQAPGKHVNYADRTKPAHTSRGESLVLLARGDTMRCEVEIILTGTAGRQTQAKDEENERTFYITEGSGKVSLGQETASVRAGSMVFVPHNTPYSVETHASPLTILSFNTSLVLHKLAASTQQPALAAK